MAMLSWIGTAGASLARLPVPEIEAMLAEAIELADAQRSPDAVAILDRAWQGLPQLPAEAALRARLSAWRGTLLLDLGHHAEADRALTDALLAARVAHGDGGIELARVQATLAEASRRRDRVELAIAWLQAAQASLESVPPGVEREFRARVGNALAVLRWRQGARDEAVRLLDDVRDLGVDDPRGVIAENHAAARSAGPEVTRPSDPLGPAADPGN